MATTYSPLFSSGLLAPRITRCTTPARSPSPMAISASPVDPVDRQLSVTPTPAGLSPKAPETYNNDERPKTRRRRSSINIGTSPMALIKSPVRNAGAALQRAGFMSPTRHHAASNEAFDQNSLFRRLRSGSVDGIPNPPKRLRRAIRYPVPLAPPPSVPLPAIPPPSPTARCGRSLLPPAFLDSLPRQPLAIKSPRADNAAGFFSPLLPSPTLLNPDYALKMPFKRSSGLDDTIDEAMKEY